MQAADIISMLPEQDSRTILYKELYLRHPLCNKPAEIKPKLKSNFTQGVHTKTTLV